jgi:hypothetical protein
MMAGAEWLLVGAVAAVGVLHTIVPDHWVPITLIARQQGWTRAEVARAALIAGTGHIVSTLLIGLVVWIAGVAFATRFGNLVSTVSSLALIAFGAWIALSSMRELRAGGHGHTHGFDDLGGNGPAAERADYEHGHDHGPGYGRENEGLARAAGDALHRPSTIGTAVLTKHVHAHRHDRTGVHTHLHDHGPETWHPAAPASPEAPLHDHRHKRPARTTLLLILGSSPMIEGIPAFFAAARYGPALIAAMAVVFACATIVTYVVLCVSSVAGLDRLKPGPLERYGEVLSGTFIAAIGLVFLLFPIL